MRWPAVWELLTRLPREAEGLKSTSIGPDAFWTAVGRPARHGEGLNAAC